MGYFRTRRPEAMRVDVIDVVAPAVRILCFYNYSCFGYGGVFAIDGPPQALGFGLERWCVVSFRMGISVRVL